MFYENLAWFTVLWVSLLIVRWLWRAAHQPVLASVPSPKRKTPRPLKPRTPHDCPVCGRPHPMPLWGNVRKPGVLPWSERKSPRDLTAITSATPTPPSMPSSATASTAWRSDPTPLCPTHAMAASLTDHVWSVQELLAFPVGQ